jgi:3-hydroxyacyl-CoA dehydrogenase
MQVTVVGVGSTGHGVARVPATAGHEVRLNDA